MSHDSDTPPPVRRFGPVTLLALAGGVVLGLLGVLVAQWSNRPEMMRGILVGFVFAGVLSGVVAGTLLERRQLMPAPAPTPQQPLSGHWLRFNMQFVLIVMTAVAIYFGAGVAWGRMLNLGTGGTLNWLLLQQLPQTPQMIVLLIGAAIFLHRWPLHPRVSHLALWGIGGMLFVQALYPFYAMYLTSQMGFGLNAGPIVWIWTTASVAVSVGALILLFAAALVDREPPDGPAQRERTTAEFFER